MDLKVRLLEDAVSTTLELGLGDESTKIMVDGQEIVKVDINPNAGRRVSINLDHEDMGADQILLAFATEMNQLDVDLNLGLLEEMDDAPMEFMDELFSLNFNALNGALPTLSLEEESLKIDSGRLEINATRAGKSIIAEGGQCIAPIEESEESSREPTHLFDQIEVNTCGGEG